MLQKHIICISGYFDGESVMSFILNMHVYRFLQSTYTLFHSTILGLIFAMFPSKSCQPTSTSSSRESVSSTEEGGKPTDLNASKATATAPPQTGPAVNSYSELGDGQVMEILAKHLTTTSGSTMCTTTQQHREGEGDADLALYRNRDLVLFKGAIEHAARLCRVMVRTH